MKIRMSHKQSFDFWVSWMQSRLYLLALRPVGLLSWFFRHMPVLNSQAGTSMSIDGRYIISCSWKGLIYLIDIGFLGPPVVIGFVVQPRPWGAHFSKDMQQIIITHGDNETTILSAAPEDGFFRRRFPIIQDWISDVPHAPPHNIVEFILQTSSAYWKHIDNSKDKDRWTFPAPAPTELDCDWEHWVSYGERFLDIPRDTCEPDG